MQVGRLSFTMDPVLGAALRKAADRVRNDLLGRALDAWEAEEGAFDEVELRSAARALGVGGRRRRVPG